MPDTRALTEDERAAMERASDAWEESAPLEDRHDEVVAFEAGFIAGLRYRDGEVDVFVEALTEITVASHVEIAARIAREALSRKASP